MEFNSISDIEMLSQLVETYQLHISKELFVMGISAAVIWLTCSHSNKEPQIEIINKVFQSVDPDVGGLLNVCTCSDTVRRRIFSSMMTELSEDLVLLKYFQKMPFFHNDIGVNQLTLNYDPKHIVKYFKKCINM